jgi:hypothetical protein
LEVLSHSFDVLASPDPAKYLLRFLRLPRLERVVQIFVVNYSLLKQIIFSLHGSRLKFIWRSSISTFSSGCEARITSGALSIAL